MPLINTSVPNLIQGVSQQPDATRFAGQCDEQVNALSSVADGLKKRPNTRHIAKLIEYAADRNSYVHFINRSASEKYVLIHDGTALKAWNIISGVQADINGAAGFVPPAGDYLHTPFPDKDIGALTIADRTFVLNKKTSVAIDSSKTAPLAERAIVFIKQGDYKKDYTIQIQVNPSSIAGGNFVQATATVTLVRYQYSYTENINQFFGVPFGTKTTTYRWRVGSVQLTSGGQDYVGAVASFTSDLAVYENADFGVTIGTVNNTDGVVTSVFPTGTQGDYAGGGVRTVPPAGGGLGITEVFNGETAPAITVSIDPQSSIGLGTTDLSAAATSGTAANNASQNANTNAIVALLYANATTNNTITDYFDVEQYGSLIIFQQKGVWDGDFTISTEDSLGNNGMAALYKTVSSISDLPTTCENGFRIKVSGDPDIDQDDYYVRFQTDSGARIGLGSWIEAEGFDIEKGFDSNTMPRVLINNDLDSFTLQTADFADREVGDLDSNPNPSFVGKEINSMFFFKNRLGFLSQDSVILSEAGLGVPNEFNNISYNFYRTTVSSLLDSAPIDISVSSTRVTDLDSAVGFQDNLILFSETGQFVLKGGDLLTTKTVSVTPATTFDYDEQVPPLPQGAYIYYPFKRGSYSGIREFTVNQTTDNYDSNEITEQIPAYIPKNIRILKGTASEDVLAVVSNEELGSIYMYNYFWSNNQKVLSAWSKFEIEGEILGLEFIESDMYLVVARDYQTHLLTLPLNAGRVKADPYLSNPNVDFDDLNVLLDERFEARCVAGNTQLSVKISSSPNTWSGLSYHMPYKLGAGSPLPAPLYRFITDDGDIFNVTYNLGVWRIVGNAPTSTIYGYVGRVYDMKYKFSQQLFKAGSGKAPTPSAASPLLLRNGAVFFERTNTFQIKVENNGRPTVITEYSALTDPTSTTVSNVSLGSGFFRYPIHSKAKNTEITIENNGPFDSQFNSAEFESLVKPRSSRYG